MAMGQCWLAQLRWLLTALLFIIKSVPAWMINYVITLRGQGLWWAHVGHEWGLAKCLRSLIPQSGTDIPKYHQKQQGGVWGWSDIGMIKDNCTLASYSIHWHPEMKGMEKLGIRDWLIFSLSSKQLSKKAWTLASYSVRYVPLPANRLWPWASYSISLNLTLLMCIKDTEAYFSCENLVKYVYKHLAP